MSSIFGRIEPDFVTLNTNQNISGSKRFFGAVTADNPIDADISGNALTASSAITVPYTGLTGTVPIWNQSTTGNALTATSATTASNVPYTGLTGTVPVWNQSTTGNALTATNALSATTATSAINVLGGLDGSIPYQSSANFTAFTAVGSTGQVLKSNGASAPSWTTNITGGAGAINGGVLGDLLFQTAATITAKLPIGLANYVLTSSGTVPQWSIAAPLATSVPYGGLTGTVPTWNQNTIGNALSASTAITQSSVDNSTNIATTSFVKTIAAPSNFLGLANSFFNSFIYSNNPNPDYMIAGNLGGLSPVVAAPIIAPGSTSFMLMGIRLQAGISFNRYGWNENAGNPLRCALYTSQFVYVPNSISAYTAAGTPANAGGKVEVTTAALVTIPITDTYYIYMDGSGASIGNAVYGAQSTNFNLMNYTDFAAATFTLLSSTEPFKVATGTRIAGASPITTMGDLKVTNAAMTYQAYVLGVFLRIVI